jgi:predicted transcriptional regulator
MPESRFPAASQIRAARSMLGWKQTDLADAAGVSKLTIVEIEKGSSDPRVSTLNRIVKAIEDAGIEFLPEEHGAGLGVRFKHGSR